MNKFALTVLCLAAAICLAAAGSGARTRTSSSPVSGQAISPSSVTSASGKFDAVDAGTIDVQGRLGVAGDLVFTNAASGIIRGGGSNGIFRLDDGVGYSVTYGTGSFACDGTDCLVTPGGNFRLADNSGTAGSGTGISAGVTGAVVHKVHKITVINTALAAAGTSDVTIWTTPANARVMRLVAEVTQVFTGGTLSAMTVMCGKTAGGNEYLLANSVFTAQNTWGDAAAEIGAGLLSATVADMGTSAAGVPGAITIQCRFTCTGASCNAATQGSVTFYIEHLVYP